MTERVALIATHAAPASMAAIEAAAGITVRHWEIPNHSFNRRKTWRNTQKTERGWIDPANTTGELKLAAADRWQAFDIVLRIAAQQNLYVANGGMISEA